MSERVQISKHGKIARVTLNRAEKYNALDQAMFEAIIAAAAEIAADRNIRAVVLHGAGGNFCAGIDLEALSGNAGDFSKALNTPLEPSPANIFQAVACAWRELPVPVIAALEGVTFGGGLQIALGADIRVAAPDTRFSIMESKWGLIPDMGMTVTLRNLVSPDRVKELAFSARVFSAAEALSYNIITTVADDPLAVATQAAEDCAAKSPDAIRGIKSLVNQAWHLSEAESLALEARLQGGIMGRHNQVEAVTANLQKRQPDFKD